MCPFFKRSAPHDSGHHRIVKGEQQQKFCEGCEDVLIVVQQWIRYLAGGSRGTVPRPCKIEASFGDLEKCAAQGCVTCRLFRRALFLAQITTQQARALRDSRDTVFVTGMPRIGIGPKNHLQQFDLLVSIGHSSKSKYSAKVACTKDARVRYPSSPMQYCTSTNFEVKTAIQGHSPFLETSRTFALIKSWADNCHQNHDLCDHLEWRGAKSTNVRKNPSHLIEILPGGRYLRLTDSGQEKMVIKYLALSYSWGDRMAMGGMEKPYGKEWQQVRNGKTTKENAPRRRIGFPLHELPATMRDAVALARYLGISHLWIDNVCIGELSGDWNHEAFRMHEVYSNAYVTLCACSTTKATDVLLQPGEAWKYPTQRCEVAELSLIEYDMALPKIRLQAPVFSRGWVLQEERLSPRIIYWCGQRVYWSCIVSNPVQIQKPTQLRDTTTNQSERFFYEDENPWLQPPQNYLWTLQPSLSDSGASERHQQWLELVQTYTQKTLSEPADKLAAISGPAAQYLTTYRDPALKNELFLAGLWKQTLAEGLAWSVQVPQDPNYNHRFIAPSWSWASVPFATETQVVHKVFQSSERLAFIRPIYTKDARLTLIQVDANQPDESQSNNRPDVLKMVVKGSQCRGIQVRGCVRPLTNAKFNLDPNSGPNSDPELTFKKVFKKVSWSEIKAKSGRSDEYNLKDFLDSEMYARNHDHGLVLASEGRRGQVVGQLDYVDPFCTTPIVSPRPTQGCFLPDGEEQELFCLELGALASASLLLQKLRVDENELFKDIDSSGTKGIYRRAGLSTRMPKNFFEDAEVEEIILV